jgi:MoaA/NifB/PqqE/SkfB family radical SAM enzyme
MENGTRTHPMNPEIFVGRCLLLQNHGFNVTVNVVAWPKQMYLIPAWAEMLRSHGLGFHFDPYSSIAYYPYEYSEAERRYLEPWIWENRRAELHTLPPEKPYTVLCSGGVDHINVQPGGSAWRCILERQLAINPLGNVFDLGFKLLKSPLPCAESWQCPACDRDKVRSEHASDRTTSS